MLREDLYALVYNDLANQKDDLPIIITIEEYEKKGFSQDEVKDVFNHFLNQNFAEGMIDYDSSFRVEAFHG